MNKQEKEQKEKEKDIEFYEKVKRLADSSVNKLKAQLAEAEKPKLKSGDYGYDCHLFKIAPADPRVFLGEHHYGCNGGDCDKTPLKFVYGNIFADLKALAEPLEEFEINDVYGRPVEFAIISDGKVRISMPCGCNDIFVETFIEAVLKLRRMEAKLKAEKE